MSFGLKGCHTLSGLLGDPEGAGGTGSDEVEVMEPYVHQGVHKVQGVCAPLDPPLGYYSNLTKPNLDPPPS